MDAAWISAVALVLAFVAFLLWSGAPLRQVAMVALLAVIAVALTALLWELLLSGAS